MNEISRCCRVLNVKHGASLEEVKLAYRDLVQIWHPDRFSENERLLRTAQERLREINVAYDYLINNAFQDGFLVNPSETTADSPEFQGATEFATSSSPPAGDAATEEDRLPRKTLWPLLAAVALLAVCGVLLFLRLHVSARNVVPLPPDNGAGNTNGNPTPTLAVKTTPELATVTPPGSFAFSNDVLNGMVFTNEDGWLQSEYLLSPPFAMRVNVELTNLPDLRLSYALGLVIFNWSDHPEELRVHDPRNASIASAAQQGLLLPNQLQELYWEITSNQMTVRVNGQVRFQSTGNYAGIKGFAGIKPHSSEVTVKTFVLETPRPLDVAPTVPRDHVDVPGDILPYMVPEKNVRVSNEQDGIALTTRTNSSNRLMSARSFQPPFTIDARVKTDAHDLRLYCGAGMIIFNWELNAQELRVHDPLNGQQFGFPGKGLISPNEWHEITWEVQKTGMRLLVDGQLRFQNKKYYTTLNAPVGIGCYKSKVTVDYFRVQK